MHTKVKIYYNCYLCDMLFFSIKTCNLLSEGSSNFSVCVQYDRAGLVWEVSQTAHQGVLGWEPSGILKYP